MTFRTWLLKALAPLTRWLGRLHWPFTHSLVSARDVAEIQRLARPGMVILTRKRGEISNLLIPGDFWTHAAMIVEGGVVEAVGKGVGAAHILDVIMDKDFVALLRPNFATVDEMQAAAAYALQCVGLPYDYLFEVGARAMYCAEVITWAYEQALSGESPFKPRYIWGVPTVIPADFFQAVDKWTRLHISPSAVQG